MPTTSKTGINNGEVITAEKITRIIDATEGYVFHHIPIDGIAGAPNVILIIPGAKGAQHIQVDENLQNVSAVGFEGNKILPVFESASSYALLRYQIDVRSEQEEQVLQVFDGTYPYSDAQGRINMKLYRNGVGEGYNGGSDCYCTIIVTRI